MIVVSCNKKGFGNPKPFWLSVGVELGGRGQL